MMSGDNLNGEMVVYVGDDDKPQIQARLQDENMWLAQAQLVNLFGTLRPNITMHIKNIFGDDELDRASVCKDLLLTTAEDGKDTLDNLGKISHKAMFTKVAKEYKSCEEHVCDQELRNIEQLYFEDLKVAQKRIEGEENIVYLRTLSL